MFVSHKDNYIPVFLFFLIMEAILKYWTVSVREHYSKDTPKNTNRVLRYILPSSFFFFKPEYGFLGP